MSTTVTYSTGSLTETSTVTAVLPDPRPHATGMALLFAERTPFHPLDPLWPDQPDDYGWAELGGQRLRVHRTLTAAHRADEPVAVDNQIDARRDEPGVIFRVAHLIEDFPNSRDIIGAPVRLHVDNARRYALSAAHTGCHLVAYAFNEATHSLWRKDTALDARGHYDFDHAAITHTRHDVGGSVDRYRLGKSLHKRGFQRQPLITHLDELTARANQTLRDWLKSDAAVHVRTDGPLLTDQREWVCDLPGGTVRMPCGGGTHVRHLSEIAEIRIEPTLDDDQSALTLTAHTSTVRAEQPYGNQFGE